MQVIPSEKNKTVKNSLKLGPLGNYVMNIAKTAIKNRGCRALFCTI